VCANLSEDGEKDDISSVINKLSDSAQEAAETQTWLEFALKCGCIDDEVFHKLMNSTNISLLC
jgi:four helix bundle protein